MTDNTLNPSFDAISGLLSPLIDILTCDRTSLTNLRLHHREVVSKLSQTGRPVLLTIEDRTLLLCDANIYFELENKRRCLLSRIKTKEDALQLGKVDLEDPRISELSETHRQIVCLESDISDSSWHLEDAKKNLAVMRERASALTADLQKSGPVPESPGC